MSTNPLELYCRRDDRQASELMGCRSCELFSLCGGVYRESEAWKCTDRCDHGQCGGESQCDLVTPAHPDRYARAQVEVRGFGFSNLEAFRMPLELPPYISGIAHGSYFKKQVPHYLNWVSLPLNRVIRFSEHGWTELFANGLAMRRKLHLPRHTRVVLTCIGKDALIEPVWKHLLTTGFVRYFKRLRLSAVVVPNFSLFEDEPRTQHFYNRKRSLIVAEEFSRHHIPVVPYLHALQEADFDYWLNFLSTRPDVGFMAAEFQTGFKDPERGQPYIARIHQLQRDLGRPLHLVVVGGVQYRELVAAYFENHWTLVASRPFLAAVNRLRMVPFAGGYAYHRTQRFPGDLFRHNHSLLAADCERLHRVHRTREKRTAIVVPSQGQPGQTAPQNGDSRP